MKSFFVAGAVSSLLLISCTYGFPIGTQERRNARWWSTTGATSLHLYLEGKNGPTHSQSTVTDTTKVGSLEVPSVGIGTISWSSDKLLELENLEIQSLVKEACDSDAAFFDTAERYGSHLKTAVGLGWGETETMLRKFLGEIPASATSRNKRPIVATKFTPSPWRTTVDSVVKACQDSCDRLGVDQIDLYQLHMPDIVQPFEVFGKTESKDEIYWEGMAECYKRGLVKNVGVSNYGPSLVKKCQEKLAQYGVPLASNQIGYSLIGRHDGAQDTLNYCNSNGIKVLAYYPFAMGLLTGKYNSISNKKVSLDTVTTLTKSKKTMLEGRDLKKYAMGGRGSVPVGGISPLLAVMEAIAELRGKTVAQVALNYIICKGAIPIPGSRSVEQLRENLGAMGWRLTKEEVNMLEQAADALGFSFDGAGFKLVNKKFVGYGVEQFNLD